MDIQNVRLTGQDTLENTILVEFDISWDYSWRDATNWDAAWVFVKYSTDSGSTWTHLTLPSSGTNPTGFSIGSGTAMEIVVPSDKAGAFVQRSGSTSGSVNTDNIQFVWDYGAAGLTDAQASATTTRVRVFAIEMVYIPQASFEAGDSDGSYDATYVGFEAGCYLPEE